MSFCCGFRGLNREAASVIISHLVYLFSPQTELCFHERCPGNETLDFRLIETLLYDAYDCELIELLRPIFTHVGRICLDTYVSYGWSSETGTHKMYWSALDFILSCVSENTEGTLCNALFGNASEAYLTFDKRTVGFLNALACKPLQKFELHYECSYVGNHLQYEHNINTSVSNLRLVSRGKEHRDKDNTICVASCLAPLVKAIRSLLYKWGHLDHIMSLQELLLIEVDFNVDDLIDLLFQQIRLTRLELYSNNIGKNDTAKLLKAVESSPLQILKISSNQMEETVALIKPFLPTLKNLTLHDVQFLPSRGYVTLHDERTIPTQNVWEVLCETIIRNVRAASTEHQSRNPVYECKQYLPLEELVISKNDLSRKLTKLPLILHCMPNFRLLNLQQSNLDIDDIKHLHTILISTLQAEDIVSCLQLGLALIFLYISFCFLLNMYNNIEVSRIRISLCSSCAVLFSFIFCLQHT